MIFGSALISGLFSQDKNIIFQKKCGRRTTKICLSSTLSLPPQHGIACCLQNNRQRPRKSPQKHPGMSQSLPPSPHRSSRGCSTDTTDGLALKSKHPQHAVLTFSFEILIAGLYPKASDIWPFLTSVTCQNPEQPQLCFPTQRSPPSSQLVRDVGLGSQESKERRPWLCITVCLFFFFLACWVGRTGPGFSTGPAGTLSSVLSWINSELNSMMFKVPLAPTVFDCTDKIYLKSWSNFEAQWASICKILLVAKMNVIIRLWD